MKSLHFALGRFVVTWAYVRHIVVISPINHLKDLLTTNDSEA